MFRPPGAPGSGLRRREHPTSPPSPPQSGRDEDEDEGDRPAYPEGPRRWRPEVLSDTAWRLVGIGAAAVLYAVGAGLPWWRTSAGDCARLYPAGDLRDACDHVAVGGSRLAVWLALTAGAVMLARLTRLGPVLLDVVAVAAAGVADLFALRAVVHGPGPGLHLTWPGPLVVVPLLGALTVAATQVYRAAGMSWQEMTEQARTERADRPSPRVPGWFRPGAIWRRRREDRYYYPSWRRRRRRRRLFLACAGLAGFALIAHGCAGLDTTPLPTQAAVPGAGAGATGGQGQPVASQSLAAPDGAGLLASARRAVAAAHSVHVQVDQVADAGVSVDLELTADQRASGTITTPGLAIYDVRRVGGTCWVRGLPGYGVAAWVSTCTIPAAAGAPTLDVAALTDWRLMVAALPSPAGAHTTGPERVTMFGSQAWQVTTPDGSAVYIGTGADSHPLRVVTARGRLGVVQVDYDRWNDTVTITPP